MDEIEKLKKEKNIYQYLSILSNIYMLHGYVVIIAVKDTPGFYFDVSLDYQLSQLGCKVSLVNKHWKSYICVIEHEVIFEKIGEMNSSITYEYKKRDFFIQSSSFNCGNTAIIKKNDQQMSVNGRGINIVVYNILSDCLIDSVCFDTHNRMYTCYRKDNNLQYSIRYREYLKAKMLSSEVVLWGNELVTQEFYLKWGKVIKIKKIVTGIESEISEKYIDGISVEKWNKDAISNEYIIICRSSEDYYLATVDLLKNFNLKLGDNILRYDLADAILEDKKIILFLGYCQLLGIKQILQNCPSVRIDYYLFHCHIGRVTRTNQRGFQTFALMMKLADILVRISTSDMMDTDVIDEQIENSVQKECRVVYMPQCLFRGFAPYKESNLRKFNDDARLFGVLRYPFLYEEKCINELVNHGKNNSEILDILSQDDLYDNETIVHNFKIAMRFIKIQSSKSDIEIYDYLEENINKIRLFYDCIHYENPLFFELSRRLVKYLQLSCNDEINNYEDYCKRNDIRIQMATEVPILPCVYKNLNIDFAEESNRLLNVKVSDDGEVVKKLNISDWIVEYSDYLRSVNKIKNILEI